MSPSKNKQIKPTRKHRVHPSYYGVPTDNVLDLKAIASRKENEEKEKIVKTKKLTRKQKKLLKQKEKQRKKDEFQKKVDAKKREKALLEKKRAKKAKKPVVKKKVPRQARDKKKPVKKYAPKDAFSWGKLAASLVPFIIIGLVIILPFASSAYYKRLEDIKGSVLGISQQAIAELKDGGAKALNMDFTGADEEFTSSVRSFQEAESRLNEINSAVSTLIKLVPRKGDELESAQNLLVAGENIAGAAADLSDAFDTLNSLDIGLLEDEEIGLTSVLVVGHASLRPAAYKVHLARVAMDGVDPSILPEEYRDTAQMVKDQLPVLENNLKQILSLTETMLSVLGHESPKRYLVLFQNNHEIRPTGGFIGSLALVDIDRGSVKKMEVPGGGSYDVSGNIGLEIESPKPMHLVNPHWELQDANWWPDFPSSAEKVEWFYEKSGGPSVDGIITLTPEIIEEMLKITGPIDMSEDYGVVIDADNFYDIVQSEAEKKYDETRESKKIIGDMAPRLLDRLFSMEKGDFGQVILLMYKALQEKDILLYFNDKYLQQEIADLGWAGEIGNPPKDYLMVVDANIGGGKTDNVIEEVIEHTADIKHDGSVFNTVTVTRTHKGEPGDVFAGAKNIDYMRIYVPQGSTFITAEGFKDPDDDLFIDPEDDLLEDEDLKEISGNVIVEETSGVRISEEFGKTVYGGWIQVEPGKGASVSVTYQLPFRLGEGEVLNEFDSYSVLFQKQPGSWDPLLVSRLYLPADYEKVWQYPSDFTNEFSAVLNVDRFYGVVLRRK